MKLTADDLKKCLNECISEIVFHHNEFSLVPKAFSRTRKWPLDKLIHFILSFGSQSLGTEILEYFQFTIVKFLLPIRSNRSRPRDTVSACVVSFNYRLA